MVKRAPLLTANSANPQNPVITWLAWLKNFYSPKPEEPPWDGTFYTPKSIPYDEKHPFRGQNVSPKFIEYMENNGFYFDENRGWWQRVWTTWTPKNQYPNLKQVLEIYMLGIEDGEVSKEWWYRILDSNVLGGVGGGGHGEGNLIWQESVGEKE